MFFGSGGFPFGGFQQARGPPRDVDNTKFYNVLGVGQQASTDEIKKAFRKLALKHHPDRGGDKEKFQELNRAHETLSDPQKRKMYDDYGEDGVRDDVGANMSDLFGGMNMGGRPPAPKKAKNVVYPLRVALSELYTGVTKSITFSRRRICNSCSGIGGKAGSVLECGGCKGRGIKIITQMIGPGMLSQTQRTCEECEGRGDVVDDKDRCKVCNGKKVVESHKQITVTVDKGATNGMEYVFHGEADEYPEVQAGDLIVQVMEIPDSKFKRKGADLIIEQEISLLDALTGVDFTVTHLDGSKVRIQNAKNEIIKPNEIKVVEDLGMPFYGKPYKFGSLLIVFRVLFPDEISQTASDAIIKAIGPKTTPESVIDKTNTHKLVEFQKKHKNPRHEGGAGDSDEENQHQQGVHCQQQ